MDGERQQHLHGAAHHHQHHHHMVPFNRAESSRSSLAGGDEDILWKIQQESERLKEVMRELGELRAREHHPGHTYQWEAGERLMEAEEEQERVKHVVWELEEYMSEQDAAREKLIALSRTMEREAEELTEELSLMAEEQFHLSRAYEEESKLLHRDFDRGHLDGQDVAARNDRKLRTMEKCLSAERKRVNKEKMELTRMINQAESLAELREREQHEMLVVIEMKMEESKRYVSMQAAKAAKVEETRRKLGAEAQSVRECEEWLLECRAATAIAEEGQKSAEEEILDIARRMRARGDYMDALRARGDADVRKVNDDIEAVREEARVLEERREEAAEDKDSVLGMQVRLQDRWIFKESRKKEFGVLRSRHVTLLHDISTVHGALAVTLQAVKASVVTPDMLSAPRKEYTAATSASMAKLEEYQVMVYERREREEAERKRQEVESVDSDASAETKNVLTEDIFGLQLSHRGSIPGRVGPEGEAGEARTETGKGHEKICGGEGLGLGRKEEGFDGVGTWKWKMKHAEEERMAAEGKREEEERIAAEKVKKAQEKRKREEEERTAAEKVKKAEEERKREEEERIAAEKVKKAEEERKREEEERIAAEKVTKAQEERKREEEERAAAEKVKKAEEERKREEEERTAAEKVKKAEEERREEEERIAAEKVKKAQEERKREEEERTAAEKVKKAEERIAVEKRMADEERIAAEKVKKAQEERKREEEERIAAEKVKKAGEKRREEEERIAAEKVKKAEEKRREEEERIAAEKVKKAEEERKREEEERAAADRGEMEEEGRAVEERKEEAEEEKDVAESDSDDKIAGSAMRKPVPTFGWNSPLGSISKDGFDDDLGVDGIPLSSPPRDKKQSPGGNRGWETPPHQRSPSPAWGSGSPKNKRSPSPGSGKKRTPSPQGGAAWGTPPASPPEKGSLSPGGGSGGERGRKGRGGRVKRGVSKGEYSPPLQVTSSPTTGKPPTPNRRTGSGLGGVTSLDDADVRGAEPDAARGRSEAADRPVVEAMRRKSGGRFSGEWLEREGVYNTPNSLRRVKGGNPDSNIACKTHLSAEVKSDMCSFSHKTL